MPYFETVEKIFTIWNYHNLLNQPCYGTIIIYLINHVIGPLLPLQPLDFFSPVCMEKARERKPL